MDERSLLLRNDLDDIRILIQGLRKQFLVARDITIEKWSKIERYVKEHDVNWEYALYVKRKQWCDPYFC